MIIINREKFEKMYNSMPVKKMAEKLKISSTTIYKILKEMGIQKKGKRQQYKKIIVEE